MIPTHQQSRPLKNETYNPDGNRVRQLKFSTWTALLGSALLLGACGRQAEKSAVIAQVGDATLTVEDLKNMVPVEILDSAGENELVDYVNQWMRSELLYQAAEAMGYGKDPRVEGRTLQAHRDIIIDVFLEDELNMRPFISDEEINAYYENNVASFTRIETEVQAAILWFNDSDRAERARQALNGGSSFSEVISDTAFGVVASNTEMEYLSQAELGDELGDSVFGIRTGTLSRVVPINDEYILVRVNDRQEAGSRRSIEEVRDEIVMRLTSDLWEMKLDELLSRLLDQADVSINIEAGIEALGGRRLP